MIAFKCPSCGEDLKVKDELAGKRGKCPKCKQFATVPIPSGVAAGAAIDAQTAAPAERFEREPETLAATGAMSAVRPADLNTLAGAGGTAAGGPSLAFLTPAEAPDEIGRLGTYRILKALGHGGMGIVFLGEDPHLKRPVAIKAMLPAIASSAENRQRFMREAQAAAAIKHDHIVTIYQVGEDRGVPFLAMEFLEGEPLDQRLQRQCPLPVADILRIGREMADGLAAAHGRGLIHRDIKPANIWLEGARARVKILDFGLARAAADQSQLTHSGMIVGTPAYMAPEQARGLPVDFRCDLFSLGCVLYRLSTGRLPFDGSDTIAILSALALHSPPPVTDINRAIPRPLAELIDRLIAKAPEDRPASAQEVVATFAAIEMGVAVAPADNKRLMTKRPVAEPEAAIQRERTRGVGRAEVTQTAPRREDDAEPRKRRKRRSREKVSIGAWVGLGVAVMAFAAVAVLAVVLAMRRGNNAAPLAQGAPAPIPGQAAPIVVPREQPPPPAVENPVVLPPPVVPAPEAKVAGPPGTIDLMALIDPQRDAIKGPSGKWTLQNGTLRIDQAVFVPKLQIPYQPPEEYDFSATFMQPILRNGVSLIMPNRHGGVFNILGGGLGLGNDLWISQKGKPEGVLRVSKPGLFRSNVKHTFTAQVRRAEVTALVDGEPVLRLPTDYSDLVVPSHWFDTKDHTLLGLSCDDPTTFYAIWVREVSGPGRGTRMPGGRALAPVDVGNDEAPLMDDLIIVLNGPSVNDRTLKRLRSCRKVAQLVLENSKITDAGIKELAPLTNLKDLSLWNTAVTDNALAESAVMQRLTALTLRRTMVTDRGMKYLGACPLLEQLALDGTAVTDDGIRALAALPKLRYLSLSGTRVSDASVPILAGLPRLDYLVVGGTALTDAGIAQLQNARPGCQVVRR